MVRARSRGRRWGLAAVPLWTLWPRAASADAFVALPTGPSTVIARDAAGDAQADPWASHGRVASASGATGGPLGYAGISFEVAPWRWLVLGGGAGVQPGGGTIAFTWRLRLPITRWFAVGFGVPVSAGPYQWVGSEVPAGGCSEVNPCPARFTRTWDAAAWFHLEPSVELRVRGGLALRIFGGRSQMFNGAAGVCASASGVGCPSRDGEVQAYAGLAVGYAF